MLLNEFHTPFRSLLEAKRPSPQEVIDIIRNALPKVGEIWQWGDRVTGKARNGAPWQFLAVIPDETPPEEAAEMLRVTKTLRHAIPGIELEVMIQRNRMRLRDITPLYVATRGEGKKLWRGRALAAA